MQIEVLYQKYLLNATVCTDTRKIEQGCIFFALKGPNFNGNTFAKQAIENGAAYCVIDEAQAEDNDKFILVDDVLTTLQHLANYHRKQLHIPVIAIVGSNGKTTTKELLNTVLATEFNVLATPGNFNNHIGLPLTLLQLTKQHQFAIIEMGANHIGENELLCNIAEPNMGIVTNNGMDHLEGFGDIEGVAKSNSELYYYLYKNNGTAFVNANDEWLMRMSKNIANRITYAANTDSRNENASYACKAISLQPNISFNLFDGTQVTSALSGDYNFDNMMVAVAIAKHLGISDDKIAEGINQYVPKNNRSQWLNTANNLVFMDAYNANPSSMEAALKNFAQLNHQHKLIIMGDMFEMGKYAAQEHQRMIDLCHSLNFEKVLAIGDFFKATDAKDYVTFNTTTQAFDYLKANPVLGKAIFVKGSRGMKLETLLEAIN